MDEWNDTKELTPEADDRGRRLSTPEKPSSIGDADNADAEEHGVRLFD